ncbi:hypothetical protein ZHAS_00010251 [Anopheles sinensis]|uniref:Uncharacterized protein n=1 Tax=Anopheles sinensis TaxID=74873 RepID=A0A084VX47_ANOSI|nr:hypothetical protein ZHAS_00010251 [Anopheles sinensis]
MRPRSSRVPAGPNQGCARRHTTHEYVTLLRDTGAKRRRSVPTVRDQPNLSKIGEVFHCTEENGG